MDCFTLFKRKKQGKLICVVVFAGEVFVDAFGDFHFAKKIEKTRDDNRRGDGKLDEADADEHTNRGGHPDVGGGGEAVDVIFVFDNNAGAQEANANDDVGDNR